MDDPPREEAKLDILELIDRLEALLNGSQRIPGTSKAIVDGNAYLDLIDELRIVVPDEIKRAQRIEDEREKVIQQGREEAQLIISRAREEAERLVQAHEVVGAASERAERILMEVKRQAEETRRGADEYALDVLHQLRNQLAQVQRTVGNGVKALERELGTPLGPLEEADREEP